MFIDHNHPPRSNDGHHHWSPPLVTTIGKKTILTNQDHQPPSLTTGTNNCSSTKIINHDHQRQWLPSTPLPPTTVTDYGHRPRSQTTVTQPGGHRLRPPTNKLHPSTAVTQRMRKNHLMDIGADVLVAMTETNTDVMNEIAVDMWLTGTEVWDGCLMIETRGWCTMTGSRAEENLILIRFLSTRCELTAKSFEKKSN